MHPKSLDNLRSFHTFVGEKVHNGADALSPEEVLDEWRVLHPQANTEEDIAAIQEAIDDMQNGDTGIRFDEFDREFRLHHHLPQT